MRRRAEPVVRLLPILRKCPPLFVCKNIGFPAIYCFGRLFAKSFAVRQKLYETKFTAKGFS
jgi:hypothetical protein